LLSRNFINVTDLETLDRLSKQFAAGSLTADNIPVGLQDGIARLSITLRLPVEFMLQDDGDMAATETVLRLPPTAFHWIQLEQMLSRFGSLRKLRLWLDHSDARPWSVVSERRLLSPLLEHLSATPMDVAIILLKLHPLYENEHRHFMGKHPA
jgi:hypothetical protein